MLERGLVPVLERATERVTEAALATEQASGQPEQVLEWVPGQTELVPARARASASVPDLATWAQFPDPELA